MLAAEGKTSKFLYPHLWSVFHTRRRERWSKINKFPSVKNIRCLPVFNSETQNKSISRSRRGFIPPDETLKMDFEIQRENNIVKNIANEIVWECSQEGFEVSQELASYVVKLKLLNPKHGFTAATVMPRSLTQQLVELVVADLKQDTPAMDCIRLQVYWNSAQLSTAKLKNDYVAMMSEKAENHLNEIIGLEKGDTGKIQKLLAQYIITYQNFKTVNLQQQMRATVAALHSITKSKEIAQFLESTNEEKVEEIKIFAKRVTGIRLYLKHTGKAGEGSEEVKELLGKIEIGREEILECMRKLAVKIENIREVITNLTPMNFFKLNVVKTGEVLLPPECDINGFVYLKKVLVIMLQHHIYLCDILSKIEEIDGSVNSLYLKYEETLERLRQTIRDRDAVPTVEVFDDFDKVGDLWEDIQSYYYCFESVYDVARKLEQINQAKYFAPTLLEKITMDKIIQMHPKSYDKKKSVEVSAKSTNPSNIFNLENSEDFHLEFGGFCAWTLYFAEGFLVPGTSEAGIFQYLDKYYAFADSRRHELWSNNPQYFLMEIYEYLRVNPEMIDLLNAYENLYRIRTLTLIQDVDRKVPTSSESVQTELHPVPKFWDKDYTYSIWELKKRALSLSRLVKCATKSVQTVSPHSHFRASIGLLAAPDEDKEVQTKRDSSCVHSTISNYLYGLRGHREDKFRVVELTRPVDETCERKIILGEEDPCRDRRRLPEIREMSCADTDEECYKYTELSGEYNKEF